MVTVEEIEQAVSALNRDELAAFRAWFEQYEADVWDREFEEDARSGKLDALAKDAVADHERSLK